MFKVVILASLILMSTASADVADWFSTESRCERLVREMKMRANNVKTWDEMIQLMRDISTPRPGDDEAMLNVRRNAMGSFRAEVAGLIYECETKCD